MVDLLITDYITYTTYTLAKNKVPDMYIEEKEEKKCLFKLKIFDITMSTYIS